MTEATNSLVELATELESRRWTLLLKGASKELVELLSTDLQFVHSSGLKEDRTAYLSSIETGAVVYQSVANRIETAVSLGAQSFVSTGTVDMHASIRGVDKRLSSIFTVVWRLEADTWRLVCHQTTLQATRAL